MRGWWSETIGGLPRTFWVLWYGNLINRVGGFVAIVLAFYLRNERHLDPSTVGLVLGLIGAGGVAGTLAGGHLADRWGRRSSLFVAQLASAVAMLALGFTQPPALIGGAAFILGVAQSMARPPFSAMMADTVPQADRRRAFGLNYWANNLAFTVAAVVGGLLAEVNFSVVFVGDAATTLVASVVIFLNAPETLPKAATDPTSAVALGAGPRRDIVFLTLCGTAFLSSVIFFQYQSTLPLTMAKDGLRPQLYGLLISINAIMIVLGQLWVPRLTKGWDDTRLLSVATLVVGAGFGITAFAHSTGLYALSIVVWTIGEMLQSPAISSIIAGLCPANARGRYMAAYSLGISAAAFAAPVAGGYVLDHFGRTALWAGSFTLGVALAALTVVLGPARTRRIEALKHAELAMGSLART